MCEQSEERMTEAIMAMVNNRTTPFFSRIMQFSCFCIVTIDLNFPQDEPSFL